MREKKSTKATGQKKKQAAGKSESKLPKTQNNVIQFPSLQGLEGMLSALGGRFEPDARDPVDEAQFLMFDAWEAPTRKEAVALAKKALKISADCADAYTFLAEQTAKTDEEALELYRKGVEAGRRALGERTFKEDVGHFWGLIETRPYMRALAGLAGELWDAGQHEEAIGHYRELLRLNPNDNQGMRDILLSHLIELGRDDEAEKLYKRYSRDSMAVWKYSRVLLDFRRSGQSATTAKALKDALKANAHVPAYLTGKKKIPKRLPAYHGFGDENEAVWYVYSNLCVWEKSPGALEWLREQTR